MNPGTAGGCRAVALRTNARTEPLGVDSAEFSWTLPTGLPAGQHGYRLQVAVADDFASMVWDTGQVSDHRPYGVRWAGPPLQSRCRYFWRVMIIPVDGPEGGWSETAWFETGLLHPTDWVGEWISGPEPAGKTDDSVLHLARSVDLSASVVRGRAYVSALGWYHLLVNGADLTDSTLVPRWTPLGEVVEYQVYDVTDHFRAGNNAVAMAVGDGRYRGRLGLGKTRAHFGNRLAGLVQLELDLSDGTQVRVVSDDRWAVTDGSLIASDPKYGERVDLRITDHEWLTAAASDRARQVDILPTPQRRLIAEEVDRVRAVTRLRGTVTVSPTGKRLVDFGQNFAGVARVRLAGPPGAVVRLTHSELLTADGELDEQWVWGPGGKNWWQRDEVTLSGDTVWYQPWFTLRGFRYLEVDGPARALTGDDVEGVVLSSALPETGSFVCSDARVNQLFSNVQWSMRSNFGDTATDCPTRERAGWAGDAQVFVATAAKLMDVQAFFRRYLRNLGIEQFDDGRVPNVIPNDHPAGADLPPATRFLQRHLSRSTGWGDAAVIIPWALYQAYGDVTVLERQYVSMSRWVGYLQREAATTRGRTRWLSRRLGRHDRYIIGSGFHYGEWLRPDDGPAAMVKMLALPAAEVATAYFAHSARLLARTADVLGRHDDAARHHRLADRVRDAWQAAFVTAGGSRIGSDRQDDYVRALAFGLLPTQQREAALRRLVELIEAAGDHLGTGFLSTPMLLPVLADNGRPDVAYRLLRQDTVPSWLYQVDRGATTTWETWAGYDKQGRGRESHNHYSFGAVADWFFEGIAGIHAAEPGYRRIRIAPVIGGGLTYAEAALQTRYGTVRSAWRVTSGLVVLSVTVPPGTTADVELLGHARRLDAGHHELSVPHDSPAAP